MSPLALLLAERELVEYRWLAALPPWATFLAVLGLLAFFGAAVYREATSAGKVKRGVVVFLRMIVACGLLVVLANLVLATSREEARDSTIVVLLDESVSMSLSDRFADGSRAAVLAEALGITREEVEKRSRLDLVKAMLAKGEGALLKALAAEARLKIYAFGRKARPLADVPRGGDPLRTGGATEGGSLFEMLEAKSPETALGDALNRVANDTRGQRVAGVVVITDGRSNAGALPPTQVADALAARGVPLFTVGVGNPDEPRDVALTDLQAPEVLLAGDRLGLRVALSAIGFEGEAAGQDLEVKLDGKLVHREAVELLGRGARQEVAVQIRIDEPGSYALTVTAPPRPGELLLDNNEVQKEIRVIEKRMKVLLIDDLPRYEFRYLKWGLIRDKSMEAQTFQISADPDFVQDGSPGTPPLRELPSTKEELFQQHVIILGDVDPAVLGEARIKLIRELVEEGGAGLLLIAGQRYMPSAYAGTQLGPLLPIETDPSDRDAIGLSPTLTVPFQPKLTVDGRAHPVTQLENTPEENLVVWESRDLPGFFWHYRAKALKPTAEALAVHPTQRTAKDQPMPIFATQQAGAGTVFYSATDDVWRWRAGVGDRFTYRFWAQTVRFLATGRLLKSKRFSVTTDRARYGVGDRIEVKATVLDPQLRPVEDETQTVYLEGPDGKTEKLELTRPPQAKGRFTGVRVADRVGGYRLWIGGGDETKPGEELAMRVFQVELPQLEKADPKMDERLLMRLATRTGGAFLTLAQAPELKDKIEASRETSFVRVAEESAWDKAPLLLLLLAPLVLEWLLRRMWKML